MSELQSQKEKLAQVEAELETLKKAPVRLMFINRGGSVLILAIWSATN